MSAPPISIAPGTVMAADYGRLIGRQRALVTGKAPHDDPRWQALRDAVELSRARVERRATSIPSAEVDADLPIAAEAARIVELLGRHRVLVVAGETGSGKTTQLPKLCLAAGRGATGMIGCTQPRRIAARTVARRVAAELGAEIGGKVGFQVRFTDQVGPDTLVKFMTDGILLAETQGDAWLSAYDTIIVDEAHERSLNIDFLLGYLRRLLERRRDLRVIVTSATIDTERFAAHFGGAPIVQVEGRTYPVEVRWKPGGAEGASLPARGESAELLAALDEISAEDPHGDVLVFLPGEREIRDAHLALARRRYRATEILPLYARLSARDQDRVFNPGTGRRIVLATNVAETSLTVPRIRYVVDPGTARVNRFSHRQKVQRLQVEPISQASADQRKGRCGRVGPGVCYRLYAPEDFAARPRYTEPELLRSSLAGVILRLLSLKLGAIEDFPFLDPPSERAVADGYQQLTELGAITKTGETFSLTDIGRTMARLPIDVKLARMLIEAHKLGVLREVLVIAAFLSIQDPRERPAAAKELADAAHAHFADTRSDFLTILALWDAYRAAHEDLTQSKLRDWCEKHFVSFLRMREWRELHRQLLLLAAELRWTPNEKPAKYEELHRAILSGLPDQVGRKEAGEPPRGKDAAKERKPRGALFVGTRSRKFRIFPGSALAKQPPPWILSATLLELSALFALTNARIEPHWIEQQAAHLLQRRHFDPHWSRDRGTVVAYEHVTLFGLSIAERRRVQYAPIDPPGARAIFIRDGLVTGDIECRARFVAECAAVLQSAREEEHKQRRHGLVKGDDELAQWFEERIPAEVNSRAALDAWDRTLSREQRRALVWTLADVLESPRSAQAQFPAEIVLAGQRFAVEYRFDPRDPADGMTLVVPLALLNAVPAARLSWLVPGLLAEKAAELIRGLPKALRKNFVPAPDFARAFCEANPSIEQTPPPLPAALGAFLSRVGGVEIPATDWNEAALPAHLRCNVRLLDADGAMLAQSRDLEALREVFGARARHEFAAAASGALAREGLTRFDFDALPERVDTGTGLAAYPALVDAGERAAIRVFEQAEDAAREHPRGVLRLLRLTLADKLKGARKQLPFSPKVALAYTAIASPDSLREDIVEAALIGRAGAPAATTRTREAFDALAAALARDVFAIAMKRLELVEETLQAYAALLPKLAPPLLGFGKANYDDLRAQLAGLVYPGFARELDGERLADLPRYLKAMTLRAERLVADPRKDQARMLEVAPFVAALAKWRAGARSTAEIERLRWLIEEFRVQLFAQELKTREPVSEKRLNKLIAAS